MIAFDQPVITIALVQGDALGGGFEAALSCDMVVAERGSKFGLPEILFNLFPGMGAYSMLARRIGAAQAERMISSGKLYAAEELQALGLVHALAEPGDGVAETHRLIQRNQRRHNGLSALFRAGRRAAPLLYEELRDITEIWVDAALQLDEHDLRKMERLTAAQDEAVDRASRVPGGLSVRERFRPWTSGSCPESAAATSCGRARTRFRAGGYARRHRSQDPGRRRSGRTGRSRTCRARRYWPRRSGARAFARGTPPPRRPQPPRAAMEHGSRIDDELVHKVGDEVGPPSSSRSARVERSTTARFAGR